MSLAVVARPMMRPSTGGLRWSARRLQSTTTTTSASTTTKAAEAAKDAASKTGQAASSYQAKAAQGLSRVTSAAGPAIAGAARGLSSALGRVGGRTGRFIGFVERQVPFVIYYSRVGLEMSKMVFRSEKMAPPTLATFQTYFQSALGTLRNPSTLVSSPATFMQQARNVSRAQLVAGGVVLAECLGFFTVGEMLGRFKLIGYHGEPTGAHH